MIRAYTTNPDHASAISAAAASRGLESSVLGTLDQRALVDESENLTVLIFDLTGAAFSAEKVSSVLDMLDPDKAPPVLYLLSTPADIEYIARSGSIVNQDYSFVPIVPENLAARLDVLALLGARRKRTLESAITDRLTGLYNRKYFLRRLEEELYRSARYSYAVGIILAEVDFKAVDGKLTEDTSTTVLAAISEFLKDRLRRTDISARFKWSEFGVLLPDISPDDSLEVAKDLKSKVEGMTIKADSATLELKLAVGHVSFPTPGLTTAIEVVQAVEDACFKAKTTGDLVAYTGV